MFGRGRHRKRRGAAATGDAVTRHDDARPEPAVDGLADGPFDEDDAPDDGEIRLDLGSVRLPVPDGSQLQVEVDQAGPVRAVHVLIPQGQLTVSAFAAPRGQSLWSEVLTELGRQLVADGARIDHLDGEFGREVHAVTQQVNLRFVGVDGPRWLLRGVAAGPAGTHDELVEQLYLMLRGTIVVRGREPLPVRSPLPLTLPEAMAEQLKQATAAQQQGQTR